MNSFYSAEELRKIGLKSYGEDVMISRKCSIYGAGEIELGSHVRVDDYSILSGKIKMGNYIHVAAYAALYAGDVGIEVRDFVNISSRTVVYAKSDDYSGESMVGPLVSEDYKKLICGKVKIEKHALIGSGCTVFPGVTVGEGASVGAMSLVNHDLDTWTIYVGIPCRILKKRSRNILELEKQFMIGK